MTYPENFDFDQHLDYLIEVAKSVPLGKVTVLTGPNGYGKSLIRKLLPPAFEKNGYAVKVASFSMERRTRPNESFSAFRSMAMDRHDDATSNHTCYMTESVLQQSPDRYIVLDEPEIGMGPEILLGLIAKIQADVEKRKTEGRFHGLLVITHSQFFIENFPHDVFLNLQGLTFQEWKDRPIKAISPEALEKWCLELSRTIEKRNSKG